MNWKTAVGFALSAFLIWWTLHDTDLGAVWAAIRGADFLLLTASVAVATTGFFWRALRWKVLLHPVEPHTRLGDRWASVNIGFMANNLLPARVGEFARAYSFARLDTRVSVSAAFGSLVVERVLDALVLAGILVGTVLMPSFPDVELGARFMAILRSAVVHLGGVGVVLVLLLVFPTAVVRITEAVARRLLPTRFARPVIEGLEAFLQALGVVRSPVLLMQALAWSVFFWLWHGVSLWLGMLAFDIDAGWVA
ncbi:MAG: lysylphosphatidylglycerol synthase transmembrane domain-containing protein, partial [Longimicrobiales bacterium]